MNRVTNTDFENKIHNYVIIYGVWHSVNNTIRPLVHDNILFLIIIILYVTIFYIC